MCWMQYQLQVFLLPANLELDGMTSHKDGLAAKYKFKMASSKVKFWVSFETRKYSGY